MTKRRRGIFLALAGGLLLLAFGPVLLILAGAEESPPALATTARPSATPPAITPSSTPTPSRTPSPTLAACEVNAGRVFLRAEARRASRALAVVGLGSRLEVLTTPTPPGAGWIHVQAGELAGWIYSTYCDPLEANR